jgi:hypothetical protein
MNPTPAPFARKRPFIHFLLRKAATLAVVTVVFGWLYGWALPWAYAEKQPAGLALGVLHGALMPLSLPSLVMGKDVTIYSPNNTGRIYKIGYICGVNICGLLFIGPLFWRPRSVAPVTSASSEKSG